MGKIYEALEKAQRERQGQKKPPLFVVLSPGERPSTGFEVAAENEMVTLSRNIDALLETYPQKSDPVHRRPRAGKAPPPSSGTSPWSPRPGSANRSFSWMPIPGAPASTTSSTSNRNSGGRRSFRDKRTFEKAICRIGDTSLYVYSTPPGSASTPQSSFLLRDKGILGRNEAEIRSRPDRLRPGLRVARRNRPVPLRGRSGSRPLGRQDPQARGGKSQEPDSPERRKSPRDGFQQPPVPHSRGPSTGDCKSWSRHTGRS